jgi:hypothetical protein
MEEMGPSHVYRIAGVGDPGTGKSGAIASVVNTGRYYLRVIDLDGNTEPLFQFIRREFWPRVHIEHVEDNLYLPGASDVVESRERPGEMVPRKLTDEVKTKGSPKAFRRIWQLLEDWPGLGPVSGWGPSDILMVDSATPLIKAVDRKVRHISGKSASEQDWKHQAAVNGDFLALMERLKSRARTPCHLYVTFHRKMIGPKEIPEQTKNVKTPEVNKEIIAAAAELWPTKFYPNSPGRECPTTVGGMFSTLLLFETVFRGEQPVRVIRTVPRPEMDVKVPVVGLPALLPLEDGLWQVFQALSKEQGNGQAKE